MKMTKIRAKDTWKNDTTKSNQISTDSRLLGVIKTELMINTQTSPSAILSSNSPGKVTESKPSMDETHFLLSDEKMRLVQNGSGSIREEAKVEISSSDNEDEETDMTSKILIIDDNSLYIEALSDLLLQFGLVSSHACSGAQAIRMTKNRLSRDDLLPYQLIFCDYSMP